LYVLRSQFNTLRHLSLFVVNASGFTRDVASVLFRVTYPDGSEHTASTEVVGTAGHSDVGQYFAYASGAGWRAGPAEAILGYYSIHWTWTDPDDSTATKTWSYRFEVVSEVDYTGPAPARWTYLEPQAIWDEDVIATDVTKPRVQRLIEEAQEYIERMTGQYFRPIPRTITLDGRNGGTLHLQVPIVGVEYARRNRSTVNIGESSLDIHFTRSDEPDRYTPASDPRKNPGVRWRNSNVAADFWEQAGDDSFGHNPFKHGRNNQLLKGIFGFVEVDGTTPSLIREAATRLVINKAPRMEFPAGHGGAPVAAGPLSQEMVDRHLVSFVKAPASKLMWAMATDKRVEEILRMFRSPIRLGAPIDRRV
jgi:hypothetical protein